MKRFLAMFLAVALLSTTAGELLNNGGQSEQQFWRKHRSPLKIPGRARWRPMARVMGARYHWRRPPLSPVQVAVSGSAQELDIHQQKFDLYTEEHPNVTIEPVDIGTERFQKLMTLVSSGTAPGYHLYQRMVLFWLTGCSDGSG